MMCKQQCEGKQPIKTGKPFQCLLPFSYSVGEGSTLLTVFFLSFFSMPPEVVTIAIEFVLLGINIFWTLLRAHFNPRLTARAKMRLSRVQIIF